MYYHNILPYIQLYKELESKSCNLENGLEALPYGHSL